MITDFREYKNSGLRNITFNGKNSLTDFGILITTDTQTDNVTARSVQDTIPLRQGVLDSSWQDGELFYEPRKLSYCFKIFAETPQELKEKAAKVKEWLGSYGDLEIIDSEYGSDWKFTNCVLKEISVKNGDKSSVSFMWLTAVFECEPYMISTAGERKLIYSWSGTGAQRLYILNNSYIVRADHDAYPYIETTIGKTASFQVNFTAAGLKGFQLDGIPANAAVVSATLLKDGQSAGEIKMLSNSQGRVYTSAAGAMTLTIQYTAEITTTRAIIENYALTQTSQMPIITVVSNAVYFRITEAVSAGDKGFELDGIPADAAVVSARLEQGSQMVSEATMYTNSVGLIRIPEAGDYTFVAIYDTNVSTQTMTIGEFTAAQTANVAVGKTGVERSTLYFTLSEKSGITGFHVIGIPKSAEIKSTSVTYNGQNAGRVTMSNTDTGSAYLSEKGAELGIAYNEKISSAKMIYGDSGGNYSVSEPKTYVLDAKCESTARVTVNDHDVDPASFTLPDDALLEISTTGYGFYELWHDNIKRGL